MIKIFNYFIINKKQAKQLAFGWTLLVFIACLLPSHEIPDIKLPLIDKWVHFLLFAGCSFTWLCSVNYFGVASLVKYWMLSIAMGALIEGLQAAFPTLGRCYELMDIVADAIGGLIGVVMFYLLYSKHLKSIGRV